MLGLGSNMKCRDSLTNKRDFCPPPCAMYVPCCSIRAVSTAQATPDQHPEQTQIEQRPDFGNIAKRQTRPSPTQSTFSVDGALPGRRCAILAGSMHSPRLAGQIGGARTEQGRGGGDVRSGRLREPTSTGRARPRQAGGVPASVVRSSPHHGQSLSRMQPGAHRPFERPLRPEERGGLILKHPPAHSTRPAVHAVERRACRMESLPADALSLVAVSGQGADARRLVVCGQ